MKTKNRIININMCGFSTSLFVLTVILIIIKIFIIYQSYKNLFPFKHCIEYLMSDIYFLITISFLITINFNVKSKIIKGVSNTVMLLFVTLFAIDIFTIYYFQSHETILSIIRAVKYGGFGFTGKAILWIVVFIIIWGIEYLFILKHIGLINRVGKFFIPDIFLLYFFGGIIIFFVQAFLMNVLISDTRNILSINIKMFKELIDTDILSINSDYENYLKNEVGLGKNLNIILIFCEGLSAIDSAHLSGNNNMPYLDKIQKNGITFKNFISQGRVSSQAHNSVLLGILGIEENYYFECNDFEICNKIGLPYFLNNQGYKTTFISTAPLAFLDERLFLENIGFQKVIGEEEFENKPKYSFDSAPDGYLYDRILQEIQNQTGKYFIGAQTISFHENWESPYCSGSDCMYKTLQYSDEKLYKFYTSLQKIGFFDSGILIIVGDHRKRTPAEYVEFELFGPLREYKSISTIVGSGIEQGMENNNIIQHTDFYYSIKKFLGNGNVEVNVFYNDVFSPSKNRDWGMIDKYFFTMHNGNFTMKNIEELKSTNIDIYNYYLALKKLWKKDYMLPKLQKNIYN